MPRRKDNVEKALLRKGFHSKEGDHHYFIYYNLEGLKTAVFTKKPLKKIEKPAGAST